MDNPIEPVVAAVRARFNGALACVRIDGAISLVALSGERLATSKSQVERTLDAILDGAVPLDPAEAERARAAIEGWLRHRSICDVVDLPALRVARSRRTLLQRVDIIARRAPRHRQQDLAPLMHAARSAATATLSVGAERVLDELARCEMSDVAWLHAIGEFAALHAGNRRERRAELRVLLILKRDERCSTRPEPAAAPRS